MLCNFVSLAIWIMLLYLWILLFIRLLGKKPYSQDIILLSTHWLGLMSWFLFATLPAVKSLIFPLKTEPPRFLRGWKLASMLSCHRGNTKQNCNFLLGKNPVCSRAMDNWNHFFRLYQRDSSNHNRRIFVSARENCKCLLNETKSLYADRVRHRIAYHKLNP